jgi:hypothetical protein
VTKERHAAEQHKGDLRSECEAGVQRREQCRGYKAVETVRLSTAGVDPVLVESSLPLGFS